MKRCTRWDIVQKFETPNDIKPDRYVAASTLRRCMSLKGNRRYELIPTEDLVATGNLGYSCQPFTRACLLVSSPLAHRTFLSIIDPYFLEGLIPFLRRHYGQRLGSKFFHMNSFDGQIGIFASGFRWSMLDDHDIPRRIAPARIGMPLICKASSNVRMSTPYQGLKSPILPWRYPIRPAFRWRLWHLSLESKRIFIAWYIISERFDKFADPTNVYLYHISIISSLLIYSTPH